MTQCVKVEHLYDLNTCYLTNFLTKETADRYYRVIKEKVFPDAIEMNIVWQNREEFIRSCPGIIADLQEKIAELRKVIKFRESLWNIKCLYYPSGKTSMHAHSHFQHQFIVSLGTERTLKVDGQDFIMKSGDAILFGPVEHEVPEEQTQEGRISIVFFY